MCGRGGGEGGYNEESQKEGESTRVNDCSV